MSWGIRQESICFWRMALFYGDNIILVWGGKEIKDGRKVVQSFLPLGGVEEGLRCEPLHLIHLHLDRFICSCVLILIYWGMDLVVLSCNPVFRMLVYFIDYLTFIEFWEGNLRNF